MMGTKLKKVGQTTLIIPMVMGIIMMGSYFALRQSTNQENLLNNTEFSKYAVYATGISVFAIMEKALERRMWEAPPDPATCLKLETFSLSGTLDGGITYSVVANYDITLGVIKMTSTTTDPHTRVSIVFQKRLKVMDASSFMLASQTSGASTLSGDITTATSIVGKDRKIYFEGPVEFTGYSFSNNPGQNFAGGSMNLPEGLSVILQAERMYFKQGIKYPWMDQYYYQNPPNDAAGHSTVLDWIRAKGVNGFKGLALANAVLTNDATTASSLIDAKYNRTPLSASLRASILKKVYPKALFCGSGPPSTPRYAAAGIDTGCYLSDPDTSVDQFWYSGTQPYGWNSLDLTCYNDNAPNAKDCNSSTTWPKGFNAWRSDAGLAGTVLGADDITKLTMPKVTWDQMEALEDEASVCGVVVTASSADSSYEDCDAADNTNVIVPYSANPSSFSCPKVYKLDVDTLPGRFKNFSVGALTGPDQNKIARRLIYAKVPLVIQQSDNSGLLPSIGTNAGRLNQPLWVISEQRLTIKPAQPDMTSPLDVNPSSIRQTYFNKDPSGNRSPLPLVFFTLDAITVISPTHKPVSTTDFKYKYPVFDGKIEPLFSVYTDYTAFEDDTFKYGVRDLNIGSVAIITGTQTPLSKPFYLRGLWGYDVDTGGATHIIDSCMLDDPSDNVPRQSWTQQVHDPFGTHIEPYGGGTLANYPGVPKTGSRFYNPASGKGTSYVPLDLGGGNYWPGAVGSPAITNVPDRTPIGFGGYPAIFALQYPYLAGSRSWGASSARINIDGIRIVLDLQGYTPPGKRSLWWQGYWDVPYPDFNQYLSFSAKHVNRRTSTGAGTWDALSNFPCQPNTYTYAGSGGTANPQYGGMYIWVTIGNFPNILISPPASFRGVGTVAAQELPIIKGAE